MSSALCVFIHASETGHAEGVPIAPSRGCSVEFPSEGKLVILSANGEKLTWKSFELRRKTVCPAIDRL